MKIFVTGACGQIGSRISELLLARGDEVLGIDNFATGRREHLPASHGGLTFVEGTIADNDLVLKLFDDFQPDVVVHTPLPIKTPRIGSTTL